MQSDIDKVLDGIIGPAGQCTCDHCQMDSIIENYQQDQGQKPVAVYQQLAS